MELQSWDLTQKKRLSKLHLQMLSSNVRYEVLHTFRGSKVKSVFFIDLGSTGSIGYISVGYWNENKIFFECKFFLILRWYSQLSKNAFWWVCLTDLRHQPMMKIIKYCLFQLDNGTECGCFTTAITFKRSTVPITAPMCFLFVSTREWRTKRTPLWQKWLNHQRIFNMSTTPCNFITPFICAETNSNEHTQLHTMRATQWVLLFGQTQDRRCRFLQNLSLSTVNSIKTTSAFRTSVMELRGVMASVSGFGTEYAMGRNKPKTLSDTKSARS